MEEIEVKIIEINKTETIEKLVSLGAEKIFDGEIYARIYDFSDNRLTSDGCLLRLRKKGDKSYLTFKKKISQDKAKVMKELEIEIPDFDKMHEILISLNYQIKTEFTKHRTTYKINDILFEIDEYEGIPVLMEIEAKDVDTIYNYVDELGFDKDNVKTWTGKELFEYYRVKD